MKTTSTHFHRRGQDGMITVIFIALLAIMMLVIMAETGSLIRLHREVRMLEQQQVKRLKADADHGAPGVVPPATNAAPTAAQP